MSVQSVERALVILDEISKNNHTTLTELARKLKYARSTVSRLSNTLLDAGYIHRNQRTKRLSLGRSVRHLINAYDNEFELRDRTESILHEYSHRIRWPLTIARATKSMMEIVATTCYQNPYALEKPDHGFKFSMFDSASGIAFLAALDAGTREKYVSISPRHLIGSDTNNENMPPINARVHDALIHGHSLYQKKESREAVLAKAIMSSYGPVGAVAVRFIRSAVNNAELEEELKPFITDFANSVSVALIE